MILNKLVRVKELRIKEQKKELNIDKLISDAKAAEKPKSFYNAMVREGLSIIGEVKKASPSKGLIKADFDPVSIAKEYEKAVDAVSVLTEEDHFLGHKDYLIQVRENIKLPILMKDFIIDQVQIYEAKVIGASCILLIVAILDNKTLKEFLKLSKMLGLDTLVEAHTEEEVVRAVDAGAEIIGINNRDLKDFSISLETTLKLRKYIPKEKLLISESGIHTGEDIKILKEANINGILVGESFMKSENIINKAQEFKRAYE